MPEEQWYTNKDLKEMFDALKDDLQATRYEIKKYNNLVSKLTSTETHLQEVEAKLDKQIETCANVRARKEGQKNLYDDLLKLWPIIISTIIFIMSMANIL